MYVCIEEDNSQKEHSNEGTGLYYLQGHQFSHGG